MDASDLEAIKDLLPGSASVAREAIDRGVRRHDAWSFEVPIGTLNDELFDAYRWTPFVLSHFKTQDDVEIGYFKRKVVLFLPDERCYHSTYASNLTSIRTSGLLTGRNISGCVPRDGFYQDSRQYIHASGSAESAIRWHYDLLGREEAGVVLEVNVGGAGVRLIRDPRSNDGIIEATSVEPQWIGSREVFLPSLAEIQELAQNKGWTCKELLSLNRLTVSKNGASSWYEGQPGILGAWWQFYCDLVKKKG